MASIVKIPLRRIPRNKIQPPIGLNDKINIGKVNINHLTQSINERSHNLNLSSIKRKQSKEN
jgi:hypothetical protein